MRTPDEKKVKDEKGVKAEKKEEDTDDDDSNADSDNDQEPKPEDAEVRDVRYKLENLDFYTRYRSYQSCVRLGLVDKWYNLVVCLKHNPGF